MELVFVENNLLSIAPVQLNYIENGIEYCMYFKTKADAEIVEAKHIDTSIQLHDVSNIEWLEGLPYPGSSEALEQMIEYGPEIYKQKEAAKQQMSNEQLRADIDYVMLIGDII